MVRSRLCINHSSSSSTLNLLNNVIRLWHQYMNLNCWHFWCSFKWLIISISLSFVDEKIYLWDCAICVEALLLFMGFRVLYEFMFMFTIYFSICWVLVPLLILCSFYQSFSVLFISLYFRFFHRSWTTALVDIMNHIMTSHG